MSHQEGDLETAHGLIPLAAHEEWDLANLSPSSQIFNALLELLAASFIRPLPQSFFSTLLLDLLTLLALVEEQTEIRRNTQHGAASCQSGRRNSLKQGMSVWTQAHLTGPPWPCKKSGQEVF